MQRAARRRMLWSTHTLRWSDHANDHAAATRGPTRRGGRFLSRPARPSGAVSRRRPLRDARHRIVAAGADRRRRAAGRPTRARVQRERRRSGAERAHAERRARAAHARERSARASCGAGGPQRPPLCDLEQAMNSPALAAPEATFDTRNFRDALGSFATGVTVITTRDAAGGAVGLTANSFNSVSLEPPMVLWSLARSSRSLAAFEGAAHWAVHVLAADQEAV